MPLLDEFSRRIDQLRVFTFGMGQHFKWKVDARERILLQKLGIGVCIRKDQHPGRRHRYTRLFSHARMVNGCDHGIFAGLLSDRIEQGVHCLVSPLILGRLL